MARVVIIGASKGIGLETTRQALEAGHTVRAFARSAADISISDPKLEKVRGDALRSNDVAAAVKGTNAVIQALGVGLGDLFGPVHLFSDATRILVAAMRAQGVKRLISVTGFGAGDSRASINCLQLLPFRFFLGRAYDDKDVQERLIKDSALDWTIVRPGLLTKAAGRDATRFSKRLRSGAMVTSHGQMSPTFSFGRLKIVPMSARRRCWCIEPQHPAAPHRRSGHDLAWASGPR